MTFLTGVALVLNWLTLSDVMKHEADFVDNPFGEEQSNVSVGAMFDKLHSMAWPLVLS